MKRNLALLELFKCRMRMFYREPEAVFWTYGFPVLLTIGLGVAFRSKGPEKVHVIIQDTPALSEIRKTLEADAAFVTVAGSASEAEAKVRKGDVEIAVFDNNGIEYRFDPTRPEATVARLKVDEAIQRAAGRADIVERKDAHLTAPGSRYVDFLVPGLLGMNLMGGGLWGIGFVTVDMRLRKLLKRLVATPMSKRDFFLSLIGSRMVFTIPETILILVTGWLLFSLAVEGTVFNIAVVAGVGALSFSGLGLLISSRARKIETVTGLMNAIMLPMWIFSGIFFSAKRFPDFLQPFIQALPLTQLNNALRAVITDGATLFSQWLPLFILTVYGVVSFVLALRWWRWT